MLASQAELAGDIDAEAARARATSLEEQLAQNRDSDLAEADLERIRSELEKAIARVTLAG